jgi:hypothetical protein
MARVLILSHAIQIDLCYQVISAFKKPHFHVIISRSDMDKISITSIIDLILLKSRGKAKSVKFVSEYFIRPRIMCFDL